LRSLVFLNHRGRNAPAIADLRVCQVNGVTVEWFYFRPADSRPSNVMSIALRAAFHRFVHRLRPFPVGSRLMTAMYRHFIAACSVGKCPRALTARRSRALMDSIAFVVQITFRISLSNCRKGVNSAHAFSHSRIIAGYFFSHFPENSANRSSAADSDTAV